jgi:hypothetical protein
MDTAFVAEGSGAGGSTELSARLREIQTRVSETAGLSALERGCLKAIAVLNLVGSEAGLTASGDVIRLAAVGPGPSEALIADCDEALRALVRGCTRTGKPNVAGSPSPIDVHVEPQSSLR